jgi:hypothetical protein
LCSCFVLHFYRYGAGYITTSNMAFDRVSPRSGRAHQFYVGGLNMYSEIVAAIQSTKTAIDLVKAANGLSNYSELLTAVTAVQIKLTDAIASELASQEKQAALAERVRELEKQIAEIGDWNTQIQRYALFQFPTGALAYALKPGQDNGEPMHYICTSCVDKKQKSTLQPHGRFLHCPVCKSDIEIQVYVPPPIRRSHNPYV